MLLFFNFIYTYIYVFLLLSGMCLMFCWYICAADICAWGYFMYFDKVSCFSLALGLDQMI